MSETIILTEKVPAVIDSKAAPILLGDDLIASVHKINKKKKERIHWETLVTLVKEMPFI